MVGPAQGQKLKTWRLVVANYYCHCRCIGRRHIGVAMRRRPVKSARQSHRIQGRLTTKTVPAPPQGNDVVSI